MELREKDKSEARRFLWEMREAMLSMDYNLEALMRQASEKIVKILYEANIDPKTASWGNLPLSVQFKINEVLRWLKEAISECFEMLALMYDDEQKEKILPFVLGRIYGKTFDERLSDYLAKFKVEMFILTLAGLAIGIGMVPLVKSIVSNFRQPYKNPLLQDAIKTPESYGRGRTNSMFTAIGNLTKNGISRGWQYGRRLDAGEKGAVGFYTFRNSSYPCDICDEYASYFHPMDDQTPPLHLSCVCGTVYVDKEGVSVFGE